MSKLKEIECKNCHMMFTPSKFNKKQKYCSDGKCQRASHRASQAKQRRRACNRTLKKRIENSEAVKEWQRQNSGYWKKYQKKHKKKRAKSLKSDTAYAQKSDVDIALLSDIALQKLLEKLILQIGQLTDREKDINYVQMGMISWLTGSALSDSIASQKNVFYDTGKNISGIS
jgi:hypothetical protein